MRRRSGTRSRSQRRSSAIAGILLLALIIVVVALITLVASSALKTDNKPAELHKLAGTGDPAAAVAALNQLGTLKVQPDGAMTGYSRDQFGPAWQDVDHNGCDTRNDVLRRDLAAITLQRGSSCIITKGTLDDPYTGRSVDFKRGVGTSEAVQIDHLVTLGNAWQTGAASWSADQRLHFANDPDELLAVDGPTNEAKGDRDASTWLPPNAAFRCTYAELQIAVKAKYQLWVTDAEHAALAAAVSACAPTP